MNADLVAHSVWSAGWTEVEALSSAASAAILLFAATFAALQVRAARQGDSLHTLLTIVERLQSSEMKFAQGALEILRAKRGDQQFLDDVVAKRGDAYEQRKALQPVFAMWEAVGILVKRNLIDKSLVMDQYALRILDHWLVLGPYVAASRFHLKDDTAHENFELLASYAMKFEGRSMLPRGHPLLLRRNDPKANVMEHRVGE